MNETFVGKIAAWVRLFHREVERYSVAVSDRTRTARGHPRSTPDRRADGSADHPPDGPHDVPRGGLIQAAFSRAPPPFARVARATCTACFRVLVLVRDIAWDSSRSPARSSASMRAFSARAGHHGPPVPEAAVHPSTIVRRRIRFPSSHSLCACRGGCSQRTPSLDLHPPRGTRGLAAATVARAAQPGPPPPRIRSARWRLAHASEGVPRQCKRTALWGRLSGLWGAAFGRPATLARAEGRGRFFRLRRAAVEDQTTTGTRR